MKHQQRIEKVIKAQKPNVDTDGRTDDRVLADSFAAMEETHTKSASRSPSLMPKLAAAAVIIIATYLLFMSPEQPGEIKTHQITQTAKLPAELTTFASFNFAYHQGGIEMVEQICDKALRMAGQRPANITLKEFSEEIDDEKSERTEL